jgi:hypothetical protein
VADAWLSGAGRIPAQVDGGSLKGGAPRAVWFTGESDPGIVSARSVAQTLIQERRPAHLVWNPFDGDIFQLIAVTLAARLLPGDLGREGRVCVQIMVVAQHRTPFTDSPLKGLSELMNWLDSWRIPRRWPAGAPLQAPQSYQAVKWRRAWARGGHFGHSQVPEEVGADPGGIDILKITGPETPMAEVPRPRFPPGEVRVPAPRRLVRPLQPLPGPVPHR